MGLTPAQGKANTAGRDPAYDLVTDELLEWSWKLYDDFSDSARVTPSIPITHFGDSGAYRESSLRILTVGLNPSRREFPASQPFARFPAARRQRISCPRTERAPARA